ncbi:MAG: hypothetical protein NXH95_13715 [Pseudomonadaceae bacterium]|nr:hypothetical protein [Pseudomonadaceae bacterium]
MDLMVNDKVDVHIDAVPERERQAQDYKDATVIAVQHQKDTKGNYLRGVEKILYQVETKEGLRMFCRADQLKKAGKPAQPAGD